MRMHWLSAIKASILSFITIFQQYLMILILLGLGAFGKCNGSYCGHCSGITQHDAWHCSGINYGGHSFPFWMRCEQCDHTNRSEALWHQPLQQQLGLKKTTMKTIPSSSKHSSTPSYPRMLKAKFFPRQNPSAVIPLLSILSVLKEPSNGIPSYFGRVQN